jgi:hypothetical protein
MKAYRLIRRHFLIADLEAGFALVRAAGDAYRKGERQDACRQLDEVRNLIEDSYNFVAGLSEPDLNQFAARRDELKRAIEEMEYVTH